MSELAIITGSRDSQKPYRGKKRSILFYSTAGLLSLSLYTSAILYFAYYINIKEQKEISALIKTQQELSTNITHFSEKLSHIAGDQDTIHNQVSSISAHFGTLEQELERERKKVKLLSNRLLSKNQQAGW